MAAAAAAHAAAAAAIQHHHSMLVQTSFDSALAASAHHGSSAIVKDGETTFPSYPKFVKLPKHGKFKAGFGPHITVINHDESAAPKGLIAGDGGGGGLSTAQAGFLSVDGRYGHKHHSSGKQGGPGFPINLDQ